ncbi:hypothetical protein D3C81_812600 [compost metagenome]
MEQQLTGRIHLSALVVEIAVVQIEGQTTLAEQLTTIVLIEGADIGIQLLAATDASASAVVQRPRLQIEAAIGAQGTLGIVQSTVQRQGEMLASEQGALAIVQAVGVQGQAGTGTQVTGAVEDICAAGQGQVAVALDPAFAVVQSGGGDDAVARQQFAVGVIQRTVDNQC